MCCNPKTATAAHRPLQSIARRKHSIPSHPTLFNKTRSINTAELQHVHELGGFTQKIEATGSSLQKDPMSQSRDRSRGTKTTAQKNGRPAGRPRDRRGEANTTAQSTATHTRTHTSARMSSSDVVSGKPLMYTEFSATGGTRRPRPSPPSSPFSPPYSPPSPPPPRRPRLRLRPPPPPPLASPFSLRSRAGRTRATDVRSSRSSCWGGGGGEWMGEEGGGLEWGAQQ